MFEILPITEALLAELGEELGGCDFTSKSQIEFLSERSTCDVQAAPGNGKTTLLTAKLVLLSRNWTSRQQGVCVISHTNAARTEVEDLLVRHPTAARLMSYPHFTGTVTAFINQYLALPYLRGLGWTVRQIDDEAFKAAALRRYPSFKALNRLANDQKFNLKRSLEDWIALLDLDPAFNDANAEPKSLSVKRRKGQWKADTDVGRDLASLKASMVRSGLYRYADMTALAWRALAETPDLADRLRARFPLVILDEAQDTSGDQLRLLEHLFNHGSTAFQRLGDSNQTLYEDDNATPVYWSPATTSIPLDESRRFGDDIGRFASRLTARRSQTIEGVATRSSNRTLFLFDKASVTDVLPAFVQVARDHWGDNCSAKDIWAVASRHSLTTQKGAWRPKSLVDYHPPYRSETAPKPKANLLCPLLRRAALYHAAARPPVEVGELIAVGIAGLARIFGVTGRNGSPVSTQNLWFSLGQRDVATPRQVRRLVRDHVLHGQAAWDEQAWHTFLAALLPLLGQVPNESAGQCVEYCDFVGEIGTVDDMARRSTKHLLVEDVTLRLGSIHSVKGKSVDGILVVESEVRKGPKAEEQCSDLATVLPHAFGVTNETFSGVALNAATNVFVGVTRPRDMLGLAMRKSHADNLIGPARAQGWTVVDLVSSTDTTPKA